MTRLPGFAKTKAILDKLYTMFPKYQDRISYYQPFDMTSVRFKVDNKTYIFMYVDDNNWCLQTEENHLNASRYIQR